MDGFWSTQPIIQQNSGGPLNLIKNRRIENGNPIVYEFIIIKTLTQGRKKHGNEFADEELGILPGSYHNKFVSHLWDSCSLVTRRRWSCSQPDS